MVLSTLDIIVRRWLLERNLCIHFYSEALFHGATCIQILTQDTLQIVNSANLPVDETGNVTIPDDFDDDLAVCIPSWQGLINLPKQDWITPLRIHDTSSGAFVPYTEIEDTEDNGFPFFGFGSAWSYFWNVDSYGSFTGRNFGGNGGTDLGYQVFKQQRRIQLTEGLSDTSVVLLYISDGQSVDSASQVDTKAGQTIKSFIDWQRSPNAANEKSPEGRTFYNQKRRLKTLLNPMTPTDIINQLRRSYTATIKN